MLDIDHFKSINDSFGHATGDKVIQQIARAVQAHTRASDLVVRYGGEEILICLIGSGYSSAMNVAQHIVNVTRRMDYPALGERKVTASIGVAEVFMDLDEAIVRADKALYTAKGSGRNRVVGDAMRYPTRFTPSNAA